MANADSPGCFAFRPDHPYIPTPVDVEFPVPLRDEDFRSAINAVSFGDASETDGRVGVGQPHTIVQNTYFAKIDMAYCRCYFPIGWHREAIGIPLP
jgi:hypothetical protein